MRLKKKKKRGQSWDWRKKMLKRLGFTGLGLNVKNLYEIWKWGIEFFFNVI